MRRPCVHLALLVSSVVSCGGGGPAQPPNFESRTTPVRVAGAADFLSLATGAGHTCGVREGETDAVALVTLEFSNGRMAQIVQNRLCKGETQ